MSTITAILRANPALLASTLLLLAIPAVLVPLALYMRGSGASLRPVVFVAVQLAPLVLVFLGAALLEARPPEAQAARTALLQVRGGQFAGREKIFGTDLAGAGPLDAKAVFPEFLGGAEHAELAVMGLRGSVLAARFPGTQQAARAGNLLWKAFAATGTTDKEMRNWRGFRPNHGDHVDMLRTGRCLLFWTGATAEEAAARRAATLAAMGFSEPGLAASERLFPALRPVAGFFGTPGVQVAGMLLLLAFSVLWFFKGSAWAAGEPPVAGVAPLPAAEVEARLLAINARDVPFRVVPGNRPGEYFASWRYADARWMDLARARGMRRTFRVRLALDARAHVVRATDYTGSFDWSAGADGASIDWHAESGILFFEKRRESVFGLQFDGHGRATGELSYQYNFDLQELKGPLVAAVTGSGWAWKPVAWQGPAWLRWLIE